MNNNEAPIHFRIEEEVSLSTSSAEQDASELPLQQGGSMPQLSQIVEALLFASQKAVTTKELLSYFKAAAAVFPESEASAFGSLKETDLAL